MSISLSHESWIVPDEVIAEFRFNLASNVHESFSSFSIMRHDINVIFLDELEDNWYIVRSSSSVKI